MLLLTPAFTEVWKSAPAKGNFNSGTKHNHPMFIKRSKGLPDDKHFDLSRENGPEIHKMFCTREFHLRRIVNVPTMVHLFGVIQTTSNLLSQNQRTTLEDFPRVGRVIFQDGFTYVHDVTAAPLNSTTLDPA